MGDVFLSKDFESGKIKLERGKKPYIKKICEMAEISVWLVDGEHVRKNICEDFVNYAHHYQLKFIPEDEFWVAEGASEEETGYYIDRMFVEYRLISSGVGYEEASKKAEEIEKRERAKSEMVKRLAAAREHKKELIEKVHKKLLEEYSGKVRVWLVNGELVRSVFYTDFGGGGHDKVYNFVPDREIWIDDDIAPEERKFIVLHEMHERNLMAKGMTYAQGHRKATEVEDFFRHKPEKVQEAIQEEIQKEEG